MVAVRGIRSDELIAAIPLVDDHPDIAGLLADAPSLPRVGAALADPYRSMGVTKVVGPETRGMILGAIVASELGAGLVCARRTGRNHPGSDITVTSEPTWTGTAQEFQMRSFDMSEDDVAIVVDDWITTGSSLRAVIAGVSQTAATYLGASVIVNKATTETIDELKVESLVSFDSIMERSQNSDRREQVEPT